MASLLETEVDENVRGALAESGYYTEGFQGGTLGEYQQWHSGAFGVDPFSTAASLRGGAPVPGSVDDPSEWLRRNPLNFSPEAGYTGPDPTNPRDVWKVQKLEEKYGQQQEKQERQRGIGMMNYLMGLSTELSGTEFGKIAPIGMAKAGMQTSYQAPVMDYSGLLGIMNQETMAAERAKAAEFNFSRDLLPSLISIGGLFGGKG